MDCVFLNVDEIIKIVECTKYNNIMRKIVREASMGCKSVILTLEEVFDYFDDLRNNGFVVERVILPKSMEDIVDPICIIKWIA